MIDFHQYENVKLEDVAEYGRAKNGHIYPRGSSTIQISATRGQIGFLEAPSKVKTKDVVIIPTSGINPRYFNMILHKNMDQFMNKYATGINIQEDEIGKFPIQYHNQDTQEAVAKFMKFLSDEDQQVQDEIDGLKMLKSKLLDAMMV